jgi:membrane protein implicated in regulation of membrane protease activity
MLGNLMWLVTILSIVGTVANIYGRRWGFAVWLGTNLSWAIYDAWIGAWAQAVLFLVYAGLAIWGLVKWRGGRPVETTP